MTKCGLERWDLYGVHLREEYSHLKYLRSILVASSTKYSVAEQQRKTIVAFP
jgi:hypothetical protein